MPLERRGLVDGIIPAPRAIGLDPKLWLNMAIANCSISVIQVRPDGSTRLISFGDVGHLPKR